MSDQQMSAIFSSVDIGAEPPLPPRHLDELLTAGRASVRRRRRSMAALAALAVILVALGAAGLRGVGVDRAAPADPRPSAASLPDRIAPYSIRTNTVSAQPGGRAIMIYEYGNGELFNQWQSLALGADRDSYRRINAAETKDGSRPWLLSPDGTTVVMTDRKQAISAIILADLVTGEQRSIALPAPTGAIPLAISPDGRYLAYSTVTVSSSQPGEIDPVLGEARRAGTLAILDLTTGHTTSQPGVTPVLAAAFAPDSRRLAVQTGQAAWVVTVDGQREQSVALPPDYTLAANGAWSPDGLLLALTGTMRRQVAFVDATGAGGSVPEPIEAEEMLGWRTGDRIIAQTWAKSGGGATISEIPLHGGAATVLSRFDHGHNCEYGMQTCMILEIRVATGLLPSLTVRPADEPDRGPWQAWLALSIAGLAAAVALLGLWLARKVRKRRREARQAVTSGPG